MVKSICVDLHSHSGYAGGVGKILPESVAKAMPLKGIDIYGTGDCLYKAWKDYLKTVFSEKDGLYFLDKYPKQYFLLQTEVIITARVSSGRKSVHTVILFPDFESIDKTITVLEKWGVKNTIGRPFIKCVDKRDVGDKLYKIRSIHDGIEIIPAHIMTPQGVFGSTNPVNTLEEFYGEGTELITAVETGLSADPVILSLIPELDDYTLISNSDCHSAQLHRIGREFTLLEVNKISYSEIIKAIRSNNVLQTAEFHPTEGKFFLTGHREDKENHNGRFCVFSPAYTPINKICPICGKKLTVGVLERAFEISAYQNGEPRELGYLAPNVKKFVHMIPLLEVLAYIYSVKNPVSRKIRERYEILVKSAGSEINIWSASPHNIHKLIGSVATNKELQCIRFILEDNFCFKPAGFDGKYGNLIVGEKDDFLSVNIIS